MAQKYDPILRRSRTSDVTTVHGSVTGTGNAVVITPATPVHVYFTGLMATFTARTSNTAACTLGIGAGGAKSVKIGSADLAAGDITAGRTVAVVYDGAAFQLLTPMAPIPAGSGTIASVAGENLAAGDFVSFYDTGGGVVTVRKASAQDGTRPAQGYVSESVALAGTAVVYVTGTNGNMSGLTVCARYFLSATTPGGVTVTAPSGAGNLVQHVGTAVSASAIIFVPNEVVIRASEPVISSDVTSDVASYTDTVLASLFDTSGVGVAPIGSFTFGGEPVISSDVTSDVASYTDTVLASLFDTSGVGVAPIGSFTFGGEPVISSDVTSDVLVLADPVVAVLLSGGSVGVSTFGSVLLGE